MIELAQQHNPGCKFHLNAVDNLRFFPADHLNLVYSFLVLQHLPDRSLIGQYLREFIRILKPGGLAVFQIPDRLSLRWRIQPRRRIYHLLNSLGFSSRRLQRWGLLPLSLIAMSEAKVEDIMSAAGGRICHKERLSENDGILYFCTR